MTSRKVGELLADFSERTTISGLLFIHKAEKLYLKILWALIFVGLVFMTVVQCYAAISLFFSRPTIVSKKIYHRSLDFPAVTFCANNPFKADKIKEQAPKLEKLLENLQSSLYDSQSDSRAKKNIVSIKMADIGNKRRRKRQVPNNDCPRGYFQLENGCYNWTGIRTTWFAAQILCQNQAAQLPYFTKFANYMELFNWWTMHYNSRDFLNEIWIGLFMNRMVWKWSNGCPYNAHYPFWGAYPIPLGFETLVTRMTYRGVLWSNGFELRPVLCFKEFQPVNSSSCAPQEFQLPPKSSTLLCNSTLINSTSWWCVANHPEWSNLTSVSKSGSCFCLLVDSYRVDMDFNDAASRCLNIGGKIAELNNVEEFGMIERLIEDLYSDGQDLMNACPFEATYANRSCFILTSPTFRSFIEAEKYCRETYTGGHLISLHSYYEHNAAYHALVTRGQYVGALGVYTGLHRNSTNSSFGWSDATVVDHTPGWSVWAIPGQPQNDPNTYMLYPFWVVLSSDLLRTRDCSSKTDSPLLQTLSSPTNSSSKMQHLNCIWGRKRIAEQDQKTRAVAALCRLDKRQTVEKSNAQFNTQIKCDANKIETVAISRTTITANTKTTSSTTRTTTSTAKCGMANDTLNTTDPMTKVSMAQEQMLYAIQAMDRNTLSNLSYKLTDLLVHSTYDGSTLENSDFETQYYPGAGNCFIFNSNGSTRKVHKAGSDKGLQLVLKLNTTEFIITSVSPGFLLVIHAPNEVIYPDSQAMKISTGFRSDITLTYIETTFRPYPYSDCLMNPESDYSVETCYRKCEQKVIVEQCHCTDPSLPSIENATFCSYDKEPCINDVKSSGIFNEQLDNCYCPQPCNVVSYDRSLSFSKFVQKSQSMKQTYHPQIQQDLKSVLIMFGGPLLIYFLQFRTASIHIFFRTLDFARYERLPSYTFLMLISDIAQFLGLWLGFSAITFFEIPPLVVAVCQAHFKKS